MVEYVKLRRGQGVELPDGTRVDSKYVGTLLDKLQSGDPYVLQPPTRQHKESITRRARPKRRGLTKPPNLLSYRAMRLTENRAKVLKAIADGYDYGYVIGRYAGVDDMKAVYRTLYGLEAAGLVDPAQESADEAHSQGRPARTTYKLTSIGRKSLREAEKRYGLILSKLTLAEQD